MTVMAVAMACVLFLCMRNVEITRGRPGSMPDDSSARGHRPRAEEGTGTTLLPTIRVTLSLKDEQGRSAGQSRVAIRNPTGQVDVRQTDLAGRVEFGLSRRQEGQVIELTAASLRSDGLFWVRKTVKVPGDCSGDLQLELRFATEVVIRGLVKNSSSKGGKLPRIWVSAWPRAPIGSSELELFNKLIEGAPHLTIPVDDAGAFSVRSLPVGFRFTFRSEDIRGGGGTPLQIESTLARDFSNWFYSANAGVFDVVLSPTEPPVVRILVKDASGNPRRGASVGFIAELVGDNGLVPSRRGVRETGSDGSVEFEIPLVAGQAYEALAGRRFWIMIREAETGIRYDSGVVALPLTVHEIRLTPQEASHAIRVRILEAPDGSPASGRKVRLSSIASGGTIATGLTNEEGFVEFTCIGQPDSHWSGSGAFPDSFQIQVEIDAEKQAQALAEAVKRGAAAEEIEQLARSEFEVELDKEQEIRLGMTR